MPSQSTIEESVEWHVIKGDCEPIITGESALQLGVIEFHEDQEVYNPISMMKVSDPVGGQSI